MNDKDRIKCNGLKKLDCLVKAALKSIEGTGFGLEAYSLVIPDGTFSEEEIREVTDAIEQAKEYPKKYCYYRGIESSLLN